MGSTKIEVEVEIKSPAKKFWKSISLSVDLFPNIFPEHFKTIEVLKEYGEPEESVRLLIYTEGTPIVTFSRIEDVDQVNKSITYTMNGGVLMNLYKNYKVTLHVAAKGEDDQLGSLVKWSCEFEKETGEVPDPDTIKDLAIKGFLELDAYLLNKA